MIYQTIGHASQPQSMASGAISKALVQSTVPRVISTASHWLIAAISRSTLRCCSAAASLAWVCFVMNHATPKPTTIGTASTPRKLSQSHSVLLLKPVPAQLKAITRASPKSSTILPMIRSHFLVEFPLLVNQI